MTEAFVHAADAEYPLSKVLQLVHVITVEIYRAGQQESECMCISVVYLHRYLDISVNDQEKLPLTHNILKQMVKSLPCLSSLDLSGNTIVQPQDEEE